MLRIVDRDKQSPGEGGWSKHPQHAVDWVAQSMCKLGGVGNLGSGGGSGGCALCGCHWCRHGAAAAGQLPMAAPWGPGCASVPAPAGVAGASGSGVGQGFVLVPVPLAAVFAAGGPLGSIGGPAAIGMPQPVLAGASGAAQYAAAGMVLAAPLMMSPLPHCHTRRFAAAIADASPTMSGNSVRTCASAGAARGAPSSSFARGESVHTHRYGAAEGHRGARRLPRESHRPAAAARWR